MDLINHITCLILKIASLEKYLRRSSSTLTFFFFFFNHGPPFHYLFTYLVVTNMQCKEMLRNVHLLTSSTVIYCRYFLFGFVL